MSDYCEYHDKPISEVTDEEIAECPVPGYGTDCDYCVFCAKEGD